ncbi:MULTISPECIES: alpha-1,4-glucan--maltose-1-phosphate maltosyltransferase [Achromobacter]|uniref:Alpha-1,4-glucan:maltose-1-phosphate maltosyltransferase n=1 Tax=Achromobacter denitrificans TaxID=32002 RepID=A0A6N0JKA3_ACHDE|nr:MULTISPECIES: alpha-1,4-glucan--maltose-1-phosphate maltosyltransferase [Achromobacter]QKQ47529.1 alpha-1,4-glucan--maltose-1-phosphate maltosyltransferase [Achromobacter denitrificans]
MPTSTAAIPVQAPLRLYRVLGGAQGRLPPGSVARPDAALCARLRRRGFNALLLPAPWLLAPGGGTRAPVDADRALLDASPVPITQWFDGAAETLSKQGLALYVDVALDRCARGAVEGTAGPDWYLPPAEDPAHDPRQPVEAREVRTLRDGPLPPGFLAAWTERLERWARHGVTGFMFQAPHSLPGEDWATLAATLRRHHPGLRLLAWAAGLTPAMLAGLRDARFDGLCSSLPWWDYRSEWLAEEDARLRDIAPVIAAPPGAGDAGPAASARGRRAIWSAALCADGLMLDEADEHTLPDVEAVNRWLADARPQGPLRMAGGRDGRCTVLLRDTVEGATAALALNPSAHAEALLDWDALAPMLPPADIVPLAPPVGDTAGGHILAPADCALFLLEPTQPVLEPSRRLRARPDGAASPRIAVEAVSPTVNGGEFAVKCIPHERIAVRADIYMDGHEQLAAELRWRAVDETRWRVQPFVRGENDRWEAAFRPRRVGAHEFVVCAWFDAWETFRHDLELKHKAGRDLRLERMEGVQLLRAALARAEAETDAGADPESGSRPARDTLQDALGRLAAPSADEGSAADMEGSPPDEEQIALLLDDGLARAMRALDDRPFEAVSPQPYPLWVDRREACFSSWYELFPRSQSPQPGRHGTFDDVIQRLPDVRAMGFDVLYLPPIHPIGQRNRKGRNNSLRAEPDDVGSPYAIGSPDGGHDAIEPRLGRLEDFLRLVEAARGQGMEMALDFAIQCSPDHPWLAQHPDWFSWRPDGSLRYAENPPKKYEDIVNVAFYGAPPRRVRKLALWRALRDVVLFWARHGVRIFRVDNPHTKPLPFWQWLIADVHAQHPDVIFLSEAFTRPKMMYRLAKIGFSQSYTYFTWRNDKAELAAYLSEVSSSPAADFFRPHFFVNTPDINPYFLQTSGRPGFLIRAALAALGAGLWGVYSGFELCEAAPLPGREEYLDSEKYELRQRDWHAEGNIRAEIARLNQIRRANPALQSHRGLTLVDSGNDRVLAFYKSTPGHGNVVLAAISLDPFNPQPARIEAPLWLFGQPDTGALAAEDLLAEGRDTWQGKTRELTLLPDQPYRVWRLSLRG